MSSIEYSGESWKVNGNGYVKWCEGKILKKKKKNWCEGKRRTNQSSEWENTILNAYDLHCIISPCLRNSALYLKK